MRRRTFLAGGGAVLGLTWIGCAGERAREPQSSSPRAHPTPTAPVVVDLHCHTFNGEDVPLAAFLSGKFHDLPPWFMIASGTVVARLAQVAAPSARCEARLLAGEGSCPAQGLADEALEIAKWVLGETVDHIARRLGLGGPVSEIDLARRFLADVDSATITRIDPDVRRARELFAARGHIFSPADRAVQLVQLVALGLLFEARSAAHAAARQLLRGALAPAELRELVRSAHPVHLAEFERLYGAALERQIERDTAEPERARFDQKILGGMKRWGERLAEAGLEALDHAALARAGARLLAHLWSQARAFGNFTVNFFRFRHDLSRDVAATYPRVQLFTPMLVDFSYWTGTAEQPRSRLADQIAVQRQLATSALDPAAVPAIGAAFLPFIAFNPLREVLVPSAPEHRPGRPLADLDGALDLVRAAVLEHGFIGVKLYPPVGFAPLGNERHRRWRDGRLERLDAALSGRELAEWRRKKADLGHHLDQALRALYAFCRDHQVPILAHSNDSNSFQPGYGWCSGPAHWLPVLDEFAGLRICLAHFGQFTGVDAGGEPAAATATRGCFNGISSYAWSYQSAELFARGEVYVDLSNSEAGTDEEARRRLLALLPKLDAHARGMLRRRLIYGSDWFMNNLNGPHDRFFEKLEATFHEVWSDPDTVADVMGGNALRYLGLVPGPDGAAPANLERVRRHHGSRLPRWLRG
jgi:predicted TIM-barrel fold metal-dependent hydrolase